jgi:hypothetical protein
MKKYILLFCLIAVSKSNAQKYSNEYLNIGVGARAHGMSGAIVANTNDVTSTYWNPAGLTQIDKPFQLGFMHAEWYAGIAQYDYLGIAKEINKAKGTYIGLSVIRLGIDNIPNTLRLVGADGSINYNNITSFSAADYAVMFSLGKKWKTNWSYGANLKVIRRVIGTFASAWGVGIDAGVQYNKGNWRFGAMAKDITTTYNSWVANLTQDEKRVFEATNNVIPSSSVEITKPTIILAGSKKFSLGTQIDLLAELDMQITTDGKRNTLVKTNTFSIDPKLGFELDYKQFLYLRAGLSNFQQVNADFGSTNKKTIFEPTFGLGIELGRFRLDYALTNVGSVADVNYSNIISVLYSFKRK